MGIPFQQAYSGNFLHASRGRADISYLVLHDAAKTDSTAKENAALFAHDALSVSAHYYVDETGVWQSVRDEDVAWHCGTKGMYVHPYCRNANSIGIALCSRSSNGRYYFSPETMVNAQTLARLLMDRYGIDRVHVLRHYDVTHKTCPVPFVEREAAWCAFRDGLEEQ